MRFWHFAVGSACTTVIGLVAGAFYTNNFLAAVMLIAVAAVLATGLWDTINGTDIDQD